MVSRRRITPALTALAGACLSFSSIAADEPASDAASRRSIVIYGDRDNGFALATLLTEVGPQMPAPSPTPTLRPIGRPTSTWSSSASCCPGRLSTWTPCGARSLLDRIGDVRVLACGNTGASLLEHEEAADRPSQRRPIGRIVPVGNCLPGWLRPKVCAQRVLGSSAHRMAPGADDRVRPWTIQTQQSDRYRLAHRHLRRRDVSRRHRRHRPHQRRKAPLADLPTGQLHALGRRLPRRRHDGRRPANCWRNLAWHLAHAAPAPLVFPEKAISKAIRARQRSSAAPTDEAYYAHQSRRTR